MANGKRGSQRIPCPLCNRVFGSLNGLANHQRVCLPVDDSAFYEGANETHGSGLGGQSYLEQLGVEADTDPWNRDELEMDFGGNDEVNLSNDEGEESDSDGSYDEMTENVNKDPPQSQPHIRETEIPLPYQFLTELHEMVGRHRGDLGMVDEFVGIMRRHSNDNTLGFSVDALVNRKKYLLNVEEMVGSNTLKPKDINVHLTSGSTATVSVFNLEAQIKSLLEDKELMSPQNLAPGYDYLSGMATEPITHYSEVHTGTDWEPARQRFCGDNPKNMPVALILFIDKSHFGSNGSLSTTPICFTLSCFNQEMRNNPKFWRLWCYLPNLSYGAKSKKMNSRLSVQDEHDCVAAAMPELIRIHKQGGIRLVVNGYRVNGKVWIHFIM